MADDAGVVHLSLRTLAVSAVLVALASVTTLTVVVSISDVDLLSTVALALAILAFVVQLIVFIVQEFAASQQLSRSQELHAQMVGLLAQLQERTQGTHASVERMSTTLLEAVIGKALPQAAAEGYTAGTPEFDERVANSVASAMSDPDDVAFPPSLPPAEAASIRTDVTSPPRDDDIRLATELMEGLGEYEIRTFRRHVADVLRYTRPHSYYGPGMTNGFPALTERGLLEPVPGYELVTLSPLGRRVARVLLADPPPPGLGDALHSVREAFRRTAPSVAGATDSVDLKDLLSAEDQDPHGS